jgi:signal transduction histidine kinase
MSSEKPGSDLDLMLLIAHEIRAPLGIVKESISLVVDKILGKTNENQQKVLLTARRNVDRIDRIIMNVVDLFKLEAGRLELQKAPFDLMTVLRQIAGTFQPVADAAGLQFKVISFSESVPVNADKSRVANVLSQLVGNALKFTEKGMVEIKVERTPSGVHCSVRDTGIGIAPENMSRLFKKYEQFGWVPGGGEKGMGIGLAVAKGIVELHGGKLYAESKPAQGSTFAFTLPA